MQRLHLIVTGEVQGVGFRWYVRRNALALGLCGEVCNRPDGTVLVEAEGGRAALEQLAACAAAGPAGAFVESVDSRWSEGPARYRDFGIGPTR
jgi:acylphosphatase